MCGIAGIMAGNGARVKRSSLEAMAAMLRHRGPDGWGCYLDDHAGLAHARLSIIDLSGGSQPLCNEDGTLWVSFNGEIFNYVELRRELEGFGHRFATRSDTEVIVHGFEQWGDGAWGRFNGQFAVALWDARGKRLRLARDRVGIVPLVYARTPEGLAFASEAKAIFAGTTLAARLDSAGLVRTFTLWATPAPHTVFEGVRSVTPGTVACFGEGGEETVQRFWEPAFEGGRGGTARTASAAADMLEERLGEAVRLRLRADVPVGAYLSGGLDSSVIAALVRRAESSVIETFSLRFADPQFDETEPQRRMASILGTRHHEILIGAEDIASALPEVLWHCETPLLRTGPAPMYLLAKLVRETGMKVVLTGEGADELLGGYDVFKENKIRRFWARQPESAARPALLSRVHRYVTGGQQGTGMWREFFGQGLAQTEDVLYSHRLRWGVGAWGARFLSPAVRGALSPEGAVSEVAGLIPADAGRWSALGRAQAIEMVTFMSAYLLTSQGDRMAMANGVEARYPFLDPGVIEGCSGLPDGLKLCGLREKVALRALAARLLPREVAGRRKWPYRAPIGAALFGEGAPEWVRSLTSGEALASTGLIDEGAAGLLCKRLIGRGGRLAEREEMALTGLLSVQALHRQFTTELAGRVERARGALAGTAPLVAVDRRTRREDGSKVAGAGGALPRASGDCAS